VNVELAQRIADRAAGVPGVARLSGGVVGEVGTYGPGRRVEGVRESGGRVEVRIVAAGSVTSLPAVAGAVRDAVAAVIDGAPVNVFVDDLDLQVIDLHALEPAQPGPQP